MVIFYNVFLKCDEGKPTELGGKFKTFDDFEKFEKTEKQSGKYLDRNFVVIDVLGVVNING